MNNTRAIVTMANSNSNTVKPYKVELEDAKPFPAVFLPSDKRFIFIKRFEGDHTNDFARMDISQFMELLNGETLCTEVELHSPVVCCEQSLKAGDFYMLYDAENKTTQLIKMLKKRSGLSSMLFGEWRLKVYGVDVGNSRSIYGLKPYSYTTDKDIFTQEVYKLVKMQVKSTPRNRNNKVSFFHSFKKMVD